MDKIRSILFKAVSWLFQQQIQAVTKTAIEDYKKEQFHIQQRSNLSFKNITPINLQAKFMSPLYLQNQYSGITKETLLKDACSELIESAREHIRIVECGSITEVRLTVLPKDWDEQ